MYGSIQNGTPKDYITEDQHDQIPWIDTSTMICEPQTKHGTEAFASRLVDTMMTGYLDLVPTAGSELKKMRHQRARMDKIVKDDSSSLTI